MSPAFLRFITILCSTKVHPFFAKLMESGAQAVYTTAAATDAVVMLEQIRQYIGDDIIVLANGASESNFLELAGPELAEGVLVLHGVDTRIRG